MAAVTGYAPVIDGRLFYEAAGSGPAVVLVHGNAGDRRHWDHQFEVFARHYRVIRYDVRGYGRSSMPPAGGSFSDHSDLAALLDHFGIEAAHLAGWSMGSGIVFDFAVEFPERTRSVISVGPWVNGHSSPAVESLLNDLAQVAAAIADGGTEAGEEAWMSAPFFAATIVDPAAGEEFRRILADYSFRAFSHPSSQVGPQPPAAARLEEIMLPVLVMTAERDIPACLEIADLISDKVQSSQKVVLKRTGHLLHMEQKDAFNEAVLAFLGELDGR